jgi:hypothetical protein
MMGGCVVVVVVCVVVVEKASRAAAFAPAAKDLAEEAGRERPRVCRDDPQHHVSSCYWRERPGRLDLRDMEEALVPCKQLTGNHHSGSMSHPTCAIHRHLLYK